MFNISSRPILIETDLFVDSISDMVIILRNVVD